MNGIVSNLGLEQRISGKPGCGIRDGRKVGTSFQKRSTTV